MWLKTVVVPLMSSTKASQAHANQACEAGAQKAHHALNAQMGHQRLRCGRWKSLAESCAPDGQLGRKHVELMTPESAAHCQRKCPRHLKELSTSSASCPNQMSKVLVAWPCEMCHSVQKLWNCRWYIARVLQVQTSREDANWNDQPVAL
jgi:hypothetical protein